MKIRPGPGGHLARTWIRPIPPILEPAWGGPSKFTNIYIVPTINFVHMLTEQRE